MRLSVELGGLVGHRELSGELSEHGLVDGHAGGKLGEVVKLVGETHGATVHVHEVAGFAWHLVDLEDTLSEHGLLELVQKVLAETHGPAGTHLGAGRGVLVHETVDGGDGAADLDGLASEDGGDLIATHAKTLSLGGLHGAESSDGLEQVTHGGEVAAVLALLAVVDDEVGGSHSVGLEGQVVVRDLLALAVDDLEHVVRSTVDALGELGLEETLGLLEVLVDALLDGLGTGLTDGDGADNGLVEVSLHGASLVTDELAVGGGGLGDVVHDTGHTLEVTLGALAVGGDDVGEHGDLGRELTLGTLESVGRGQGSGSGGTTEGGAVALVALLLVGHALVEGTGSLGKVLGHLTTVAGVAATSLGELVLQGDGERLHLSGGGGLVLVHEEFELATGTLGGREAAVGDTHDTLELSGHATVDTHLFGTVGDNLTGDDGDLTDETSLDVLHLSGHSGHLGGEVLAELTHLVGGLTAGGVEVLDGLGEAGVSEGSLLGEGIVEASGGGTELLVEAGTAVSELLVGLTELLGGLLLGDLQLGSGELEGSLGTGLLGTDLGDGGGR